MSSASVVIGALKIKGTVRLYKQIERFYIQQFDEKDSHIFWIGIRSQAWKKETLFYLTIRWFCMVHFVNSDDHLFHPKGIGKQCVLSCLSTLRDASFKFANASSND